MKTTRIIFKLNLLMLIFLLISACDERIPAYDVALLTGKPSQYSMRPHSNLTVRVSEKFENQQLIGGSDFSRNINFEEIIPWLRSRVGSIHSLDCALTKSIDVNIIVKKLYTTIDSNVLVGTLVLKINFTTNHGNIIVRNYRGDCKMNYFSVTESSGIRACLNSSLDFIISNIKRDICEM